MLKNNQHRLLSRQLKKSGLDDLDNPKLAEFLSKVNDAYKSFDNDVRHIEHILEESSKELFVKNQNLSAERDNTLNKLENIVDNVIGVIFETDLDGNYTFLNNAWEKYSGIPLDQAIGRNFLEFLDPEQVDGTKDFKQVFSSNKKYIKFIFTHQQADTVMWFEVRAKLINDDQGNPLKYVGTIVDITNLKKIEIELKKASEAKDAFLSTMSHEIRTPLNAVTGLANILLMEDYLPNQEENLKALKYSGEHLLGLINDLLDFNKIKSGKVNVVEKNFSLSYFLENIESHFALRIREKGIEFKVIKEGDIPENIIGDKLKLTQIIKNLLSNSLKFTKKGTIILRLKNKGTENGKIKLEFAVEDTGIGISASKQKTIFESFMQADSETSVKYGGTGLGLSISRKLLNLQNSDINVNSTLGKGAIFSFIIEYKISNESNDFETDMIKMQPNYEPLDINILVAEDNKMNILVLRRFLENWKVTFEIVENGNEVLKSLNKSKLNFDLILMDLQMPELNGYETTNIIRKMDDPIMANIPIIALTAFAQTDIKVKTEQYKMDGFMGKPFNPVELYNLLSKYVKKLDKRKAI